MERINELYPSLEERSKDKDDAVFRVARQRAGSSIVATLMTVIGIPIYLVITLPLALIGFVHRLLCFKGKRQSSEQLCTEDVKQVTEAQAAIPAFNARKYDIVVMGATGLTGSVLARYLASYHSSVKVALAGRTRTKVEAVKETLGAEAAGFDVIVADSNDLASLFAMCRQTKVVATTVGPFKRFGSKLVHACAHSGTHYADITGEPDWVNHMARLYDAVAKKKGAAIVSMCGVDSVPSDVGSFLAVQRLREEHGSETTVTHIEAVMTKFSGGAPAGTIETVAGIVDGTDVLQTAPLGFKQEERAARLGSTTCVGLNYPFPTASPAFKQYTIPFFMAGANSSTVRRTNAQVGYAPNVKYTERWGFPDFSAALSMAIGFMFSGPYIGLPLLRSFVRSAGLLPKPGDGAKAVTAQSCIKGSVCMLVCATGTTGAGATVTKKLCFVGMGDAGVLHTCVNHGEIAVLLTKRDEDKALHGAGMTPISALGNALPDALLKTGLVFIEDEIPKNLRK